MKKQAIVLLSGGLDSTTVVALARAQGFNPCALSFRYGQRHHIELKAASRVVEVMEIEKHVVADIDLRVLGGSALTADIDVPKYRDGNIGEEIPVTYVPARNTIFLSFALAWAEVLEVADIFIGVNAMDYSGYPDCRPAFIEAFQAMANLATVAGAEGRQKIRIHTPLMLMSKAEIIKAGIDHGVDYSLTTSCYDPAETGKPCGQCDSCILRAKGFSELGIADPQTVLFENS